MGGPLGHGMTNRITRSNGVSTRLLLVLGLAATLSFSSICGLELWRMGDADYRHHHNAATNLIASIASEIDRNIELYDLSLQAVVDGIKIPDIDTIRPELRQVVLFDRAASARDLGSILVLDAAGDVRLDSRSLTPARANFADRDFFKVHLANANAGLFISRPWVAKGGEYLISLSRRIDRADGSFGGVVAGSMRLSYFHNLFRKLQFGSKDSMTLLHTDGTILMRAPFNIDTIGQSLKGSDVFRQFPPVAAGTYTKASMLDQVKRLFVFQQVGNRPLLIIDGVSFNTIYADWWQEVWLIGSFLLALCVATTVLSVLLANALKRRSAAERQLAKLAATDGLTGVSNRRHFDETLDNEWRRALRSRSPISLLMIDVDHFKAFNDTHGHQAGDAALASVAECIAGGAKRASDLVARYGGEEFAVLLAGETVEGAVQIAELIRASVASLREQQQGRPDMAPTVSIGVACVVPGADLAPEDLIKSADVALYEAKRQGRDRTVVAPSAKNVRARLVA
ncbi:sensor domain-containing diguanylate cyclase [Bradyrhizobium ganzhouense]|uniref:sensor domain-containing diguanylate cyclase n=1 Tax=Bradyrhizobium ganzhouense TaxID=1179767 RepID=UPI003CEE25D6